MFQNLLLNHPPRPEKTRKPEQRTGFIRALLLLLLLALSTGFTAFAQTPLYFKTGTGTSGNTIPLNQGSQKTQLLYAPGDFNTLPISGLITKIYFRNSAAGTAGTYTNFQVSFIQNTDPSFPNSTFLTGLTVAHSAATQTITANATAGGWFEIPLNNPFLYDNTQSLIVEIQYSAISGGISTTTSTSVGNKRRSGTSLTATTGTTNTTHNDFGMDVIPNSPCTAPPTAGIAEASVSTICANATFNLSLTGNSLGLGQTYQWETSPNGTTGWTAIGTAAASPFLTTTQSAGTHFYRAAVTCSGQTAFSSVISVTSPALVSGTFTINKTIPASATNFTTFTDAINHISCGINGPVVFNVVSGSGPYTEQFEIGQIGGMSATNTVTFNGNGNTISADPVTGNRAVIRLNGADYVTINNLTIETTGNTTSSFGWGIHLTNGANFNTISNNTINIGSLSTTESNSGGIIFSNTLTSAVSTGDNGNNNLITGNTITGGFKAIGLYGLAASVGANQIINNTLRDFYGTGIELGGANATLVEGNNISRPTRVTVTTFEGIALSGATQNSVISKNRIHNTHGGASALTGTVYGVYSTANDAPAGSENLVKNNLVYGINNTGTIYGIYNSGSDGVYYYHNTVNLTNSANTGINRGFFQTTAATNIKFMNNIVRIVGGATGAKHAIYYGTATSAIDSDRNVLFVTSGATTSGVGFVASNQITLADWQTASGDDANSVSADPRFVNAGTGNFTPTSFAVNNIGAPVVPAVTDDITGAARSTTTPDPGAYEFTLPAIDLSAIALAEPVAKVFFTNAEQVTITIQNVGSGPVDFSTNNATITVNVTGVATQTLVATLTTNALNGGLPLAVGATLNVPVGTLNMSAAGNYIFNATVSVSGDGNAANNAMSPVTLRVTPITAGTALGYTSLCTGDSTWLTLRGYNGNIQWQQFNGTSWVNATTADATSDFFKIKPTTATQYRAVVSFGTSASDTSNVIAVNIGTPAIVATQNATICGSGPATLTATPSAGDVIKWYSAATGGTPLATGNTFTPTVSATTTYHAEASRFKTAGRVGPVDNTIGAGGYGNFSNQTVFDVQQTMRLDFVTLISDGPVSFKVFLRDTVDGTFLDSAVVQLRSAGTHRVPLGFVIQPGQHYAIGIPNFSGSGQLWRSTGGTAFPYTLPGVVSITGTNFTPPTSRYYYFYDWTVSTINCPSARQAVTATVVAVNLGPNQTVCSGTPVTLDAGNVGATYQWSLNNSPITGATSQTLNVTASGTYVATVTAGTCITTDTVVVTINPKPATPVITKTGNTLSIPTVTGATYQWYSVAGSTLTAVPGATAVTFTPATNGDYTVKITVNGCESDEATAMTVVLGIASLAPGMEVSVYPNPTAGKFTVNLVGFEKEATVQIISVTGQVLANEKVTIASDETSKAFDLGGMAKGVYILKVTSGNNLTFRKVILD